MDTYGVSFSIKQCRNFNIQPSSCLKWLIQNGFRRFRLMSYWDEIEATEGIYDFEALDKQIELIAKHKGTITLCLGARQPRWPENHWPSWAWDATYSDRSEALLRFIETVVKRYRNHEAIISYQLENEALLKSFGTRAEVDRQRLRTEFGLIKKLDSSRPVIMTTSTSWGIPTRRPIGDIVGFSYYRRIYSSRKEKYTTAFHKEWLHTFRGWLIKIFLNRHSFIHELQLEPWGPKNIWEMPFDEQYKSMSPQHIQQNITLAQNTGLKPIDVWGGEWWYWSYLQGNTDVVETVVSTLKK